MLDWLGEESDRIRIAFTKVFGSRYKAFGNQALHVGGFSDGREGVQWNVGYDPRDGRQWVGVNLEGMQYDDWPIARLIDSELKSPSLHAVIRDNAAVGDVLAHWRRDFWQANSRPEIQERDITPTPVALRDLSQEDWRAATKEAQECLDRAKKRKGRASQQVTLQSTGAQVKGPVSPHLTFEYYAPERMEWEPFMRAAKERMAPLHKWASERAALPIRF